MGTHLYAADNWQTTDGSKYTGRRLRQMIGGLIGGARAGRTLGARSGVWVGTPSSTVTVSGTTVTVAEHGGVLDLQSAAIAGPYLYANDAPVTFAVPAANASLDRTDLVIVTVSDPTEGDGTVSPDVKIDYKAGVAGGNVPATPARSFVLARVSVPRGASTLPAVSWVAPLTTASGGVLPVAGVNDYPAGPYVGQYVHDTVTNELLRWTGAAWRRPRGTAHTGTYSGTSDASGYLTVTHGLGFAPSRVDAASSQGGSALPNIAVAMTVDSITATTFRIRFMAFGAISSGYWLMNWGAGMATAGTWAAWE